MDELTAGQVVGGSNSSRRASRLRHIRHHGYLRKTKRYLSMSVSNTNWHVPVNCLSWSMSNIPEKPDPLEINKPISDPTIGEFFEGHEELVRDLGQLSLESAASRVGGMLTMPETQSNIIRFEILQHLIVAAANGTAALESSLLKACLDDLGASYAGRLEDPAEDVFVSRVSGPNADYLVFEGIYEGSAYYLQRFLNVLQKMPEEEPFSGIKRSAFALLTLINEVVKRSSLMAYTVGSEMPFDQVPHMLVRQSNRTSARVIFTKDDLEGLGIAVEDLDPFVFEPESKRMLRDETYGHSSLERAPLIRVGELLYVALPTSISVAIRRLIVEFAVSAGREEALYLAYAQELAEAFSRTPMLGGSPAPPLPFQSLEGVFLANISHYFDQGRVIHLCFVVDDFGGFEDSGVVEFGPSRSKYGSLIDGSIRQVFDSFESDAEFREGLTLVVLCPWARPMAAQFEGINDHRWRIEMISAVDLEVLSWDSNFSPHRLWSLLDARDKLAQLNVELFNINGLLNLYSWSEQLEGHIVPHGELPDEELGRPLTIVVQQNSLLDVRRKAAVAWDVHHARTWDGRVVQVRRHSEDSIFDEDRHKPLYVSFDDVERGKLLAVYETSNRGWWVSVDTPMKAGRDLNYRLWHALCTWLARSAEVLESKLSDLPPGPILWHCKFLDIDLSDPADPVPDRQKAEALLSAHIEDNLVRVTAEQGFLFSFRHPTNLGERLLVQKFVEGTAALAPGKRSSEELEATINDIVPSEWARDMHLLVARRFRDFLGHRRTGKMLLIEKADDALSRIGLGWRVRKQEDGSRIVGAENCNSYLNSVVESIWQDIKEQLKHYAREPVLLALVSNHESIAIESDRWHRTARSLLAFHNDKEETARAATYQVAKFTASSLCTRILIEMALCECPDVGDTPGRIDLSRLMTKVMQLHHFGGWSEAIRYGCKQPEVRIRPLGDIHTNIDFDAKVAMPYGLALGKMRFHYGADSYETFFREETPVENSEGKFEEEYWKAWTETFGFTIDDLRTFLDNVESEGIRRQELFFLASADDLIALKENGAQEAETVRRILDTFSLEPRSTWASSPIGFRDKDWYPWRFRRRLSVISRPIFQLSNDKAGACVIAPGMIRDGAAKVVEYCHSGGYDAKDFPEGAMRSWIGAQENRRGHAFNKTVAEKFRAQGWQARSDIKLTEILNTKLEKDFGDVDVLAWKGNRVIAVECKDLELAMTPSDIARQLYEFRGEKSRNGRPDRLMKHLIRMDVLNGYQDSVAKFICSPGSIGIETGLVFSEIVPMSFTSIAADKDVQLTTIDELHTI